jgi:DNA topoisomerase-1
VQLLNGRYGAYLKIGKDNFKLPKDCQPELLTLEDCLEIAANQPTKSIKKRQIRKK